MSKQAVLLIHGIGEQRPMDTLRGFVDVVWTKDSNLHRKEGRSADSVWSKPYSLSENFELRLLTTAENKAGIRTDFYELYWAHLMTGTTIAHVLAWAKALLWRSPSRVPKQLLLAYCVLHALLITAVVLVVSGVFADVEGASTPWIRYTLSLLIVPLGTWVLTSIVGDAARYLHAAATNVQCRHEIRAAGAAVLKTLHDAKYKYDRIIVVGHSLGTVIGYDILNHVWAAYNREPGNKTPRAYQALADLEGMARKIVDGSPIPAEDIQRAQRQYFDELRTNGMPWRVTDFITLGSPLAHAAILLADDSKELSRRINDREFPSCLPALETTQKDHVQIRGFSYPAGAAERNPHHGAVFAPTRWTNFYFPCSLLIWGDLIGGPLAGLFGRGVRDVKVSTRKWFGLFSHTFYWTPHGKDEHLAKLRKALDLLDGYEEPAAAQEIA